MISIREIRKSLKFINKKKKQSLFHVSEMIEAPYECINKIGVNWKLLSKSFLVNRQNYKKYYFITGSMFYFFKKLFFKKKKFLLKDLMPTKLIKLILLISIQNLIMKMQNYYLKKNIETK